MNNIYISLITLNCISNKYSTWYIRICQNAKNRLTSTDKTNLRKESTKLVGYSECHHIWPRSICENEAQKKDITNLVFLTAREHFICHLLLTKMFSDTRKYKMCSAISRFLQNNKFQDRRLTSHQYSLVRKLASVASSFRGKNMSNDTKAKISLSMRKLHLAGAIKYNRAASSIRMKMLHKNGILNNSTRHNDPIRNLKIKNSLLGKCGRDSRGYRGIYITPFGSFESSYSAAAFLHISNPTITKLCIRKNDIPIKDVRKIKKYWPKAEIGKTPKEQGWSFISKANNPKFSPFI